LHNNSNVSSIFFFLKNKNKNKNARHINIVV
jgi:hypothetical protein